MRDFTAKEALRRCAAAWGANAVVEDQRRRLGPSSPERRAASSKERDRLLGIKPTFVPMNDWPAETTLGEYREALRVHNFALSIWRKGHDDASWRASYYRYKVGTAGKLFFTVKGSGDSWRQALAAAGISVLTLAPVKK